MSGEHRKRASFHFGNEASDVAGRENTGDLLWTAAGLDRSRLPARDEPDDWTVYIVGNPDGTAPARLAEVVSPT